NSLASRLARSYPRHRCQSGSDLLCLPRRSLDEGGSRVPCAPLKLARLPACSLLPSSLKPVRLGPFYACHDVASAKAGRASRSLKLLNSSFCLLTLFTTTGKILKYVLSATACD